MTIRPYFHFHPQKREKLSHKLKFCPASKILTSVCSPHQCLTPPPPSPTTVHFQAFLNVGGVRSSIFRSQVTPVGWGTCCRLSPEIISKFWFSMPSVYQHRFQRPVEALQGSLLRLSTAAHICRSKTSAMILHICLWQLTRRLRCPNVTAVPTRVEIK